MDNIEFHILEAQEYMNNKKPEQALEHALKVPEIEPANEKGHFFVAVAYHKLNKFEDAIPNFINALPY
jgi:Tfp pilus assembly protein PilF